jgi:nucleoside-diphosphate-sugar epimerase
MTSRDRSRRNRRTPSVAFTVPGDGPLARLLAERLSAVDAGDTWVHVAYEPGAALGQAEVPSLDTFLVAAAAAGAGHIVVVTSAMVLGPVTDATLPIPEDAPVAPPCGDPEVDRLRSLEHQVQELRRHPDGPRLHVLRPAVVVGPGLDSPFVRHFASPLLLTARGSQPAWQFCHVDDLASACRWVVAEDLDEAAVGAPGHLDALDLARLARRRRLELPEAALLGAAERLHQFGVSPTSSGLMRYLVHPWPVEVSRLPAVGWTATVDNATGLQLLIDVARDRVGVAGRLVPRREAVGGAAGAAGVTVAALGAAALVRRARRRNGGGAG